MSFYNKESNLDSKMVVASAGGTAKALAHGFNGIKQLGDIQQKKEDRTAKINLEKENKIKEQNKKKSIISGMRKIHPKSSQGLSDDEVYLLANKINDVHEDKTKRKMSDVFTAENGDRVGVYDTGETDKNGKRIYQNVSFGKVKDFNKPKASDDEDAFEIGRIKTEKRAKQRLKTNPNSKAAKKVISNTEEFKMNAKSNSNVGDISFDIDGSKSLNKSLPKPKEKPFDKAKHSKATALNKELNKTIREYNKTRNKDLLKKAQMLREKIKTL